MSGTVVLKGQGARLDQLSGFALAARLAGAQHWEDWRIARHKTIEVQKLPGNFCYQVERLLGGQDIRKGKFIANATFGLTVATLAFAFFTALLGLAVAVIPVHLSFFGTLVEVFLIIGSTTLVLGFVASAGWGLSTMRVVHPARWITLPWDLSMDDRGTKMPAAARDVAERLSGKMPGTEYELDKLLRPSYHGLFDPILWACNPLTDEKRAVWVWNPDGSTVDPSTVT